MVVALIAVFVALGGVGYAAVTLPKNSVGAKQLKKNAVTGKKIKKNAVTSAKVKDSSLLAQDFHAGQLPAGPKGDKGDQGPPGPTFGAAVMGSSSVPLSDPAAAPDETSAVATGLGRHFDFVLPASGSVYIRMLEPLMSASCSAGFAKAGLYLDGAPVPNSAHNLPTLSDHAGAELVVIRTLSAGPHSVEALWDCPGGTSSGYTVTGAPTWTVLQLGN